MLILILCFCGGVTAFAKKSEPQFDSSKVEVKKFSESELDDFRGRRDFTYEEPKADEMNFLQRLFSWLLQKFFTNPIAQKAWDIVPYIFIALAIIFLILGLLRTSISNLVTGKGAAAIEYNVHEENIHEIDFDKEIRLAIENKLYRKAVRLSYLQVLKMLSDKSLINWKIHKTNSEYHSELKTPVLASEFREVTNVFERTWYGDMDVNETLYNSVAQTFSSYKNKIKAAP